MADLLTSPQKAKQRADDHRSKFYLSVQKPAVLLTASVNNGAIARGATAVAFDGGTSVDVARIRPGQTLVVATSLGEFKVRVASFSSSGSSPNITGTITVDNNPIPFADDDGLTLYESQEPTVIPPTFDPATGISTKRGAAFANQTLLPGPVARAGPHPVGFVEAATDYDERIASGPDDGLVTSLGQYSATGTTIGLGQTAGVDLSDWLRLITLNIPQGALILSAVLYFTASASEGGDMAVRIEGELDDNPAAPASKADYDGRVRTSTEVDWNFSTAWVTDQEYASPDLSGILQEIADAGGCTHVQLFITNNGGTNKRTFHAFNGDPAKAARLEVSWVIPTVFNLNGTATPMSPGATISSWLWESTVGTIAAPTAQNTTLTLTEPEEGWLYLTTTDSNGKVHTTARHVWGHDPDPLSVDYPYVDWELASIPLAFDGGSRVNVKVSGVSDFSQFVDGALVVIWREAWFGDEAGAISLITNGEKHLFAGYIVKDSVTQDSEHGTVTFEVWSVVDVMKSLNLQSLSIHAETLVQYWFQMPAFATVARMLYWLLYWHTNLLDIADFTFPASTLLKKLFAYNDSTVGSQVQDLAAKVLAQLGCNKAGQVFIEENVQYLDQTGRDAVEIVSDVTAADRREEVVIVRRQYQVAASVEVNGFYFDGVNVIPYCAIAPTKVRATRGAKKSLEGMVVSSQEYTNYLAGRAYAVENSEIEEIRVKFAGDYSVVDVFPQRWWRITIAEEDTVRGIVETDLRMVPRVVNLQPDNRDGVLLVDVVFQPEAPEGPDGVPKTCASTGAPVVAEPPNWPRTPATDSPGSASALLAGQSVNYRGKNDSQYTAWSDEAAVHIAVDRFWKTKQASTSPSKGIAWLAGAGAIWRVTKSGQTDRTPANNPGNDWTDTPAPTVADLSFVQVLSDPFVQNWQFVLARWQNGSSLWRGWLLVTQNDGVSWTYYPLYDGSVPDQVKPLWLAVNQSNVLVATWEVRSGTGKLMLHRRDTDLNFVEEFDLGLCNATELNDGELDAFPVAVLDDADLWYVAGRMADPVGLSAEQHIIRTVDAGQNWTSFESGWGTDVCQALLVDSDTTRKMWAVRAGADYEPLSLEAGSYPAVLQMSATRAVAAYQVSAFPSGRGKVSLLDTSTNPPTVLETQVLPGATDIYDYLSLARYSDTQFMLVAHDNASGTHAVIGILFEITGALLDTMDQGTRATIHLNAQAVDVTAAILSATKAVCTYTQTNDSNRGKGAVLDLDWGTLEITPNAVQTFQGAMAASWPCVCKVDATTALVVYTGTGPSLYANVLDAITTSWTLGGDTTIEGDDQVFDAGAGTSRFLEYVSDGSTLVLYQVRVSDGMGGFHYVIASRPISVSGSTPSPGSRSLLTTIGYHSTPIVTVGGGLAWALYEDDVAIDFVRLKLSTGGLVQSSKVAVNFAATLSNQFAIHTAGLADPVICYVDDEDSDMIKVLLIS